MRRALCGDCRGVKVTGSGAGGAAMLTDMKPGGVACSCGSPMWKQRSPFNLRQQSKTCRCWLGGACEQLTDTAAKMPGTDMPKPIVRASVVVSPPPPSKGADPVHETPYRARSGSNGRIEHARGAGATVPC